MSLTLRIFITNFAGACFVAWAWSLGYIARVMEGDVAHMSEIMAALFLIGIISTFRMSFKIEKSRAGASLKDIRAMMIKGEHLLVFAAALFILSIIGNATGIKSMFIGLDAQSLATPDGAVKLGVQTMGGAGMAFGSTIIGATLYLWTTFNALMLYTEMKLLELDKS